MYILQATRQSVLLVWGGNGGQPDLRDFLPLSTRKSRSSGCPSFTRKSMNDRLVSPNTGRQPFPPEGD
jgi:hypothetical protein